MKKVPNRKVKVKLNKIILQILFLILVSTILITQKENILNIFTNKNKIKAGIPDEMKIGDIIKYDHKKGVKPEDLKTTIKKGTATTPGSTYEQTLDASTIDTTWQVFKKDEKNDEIVIISDNIPVFKMYGSIDYIWYDHNMYQFASIFGHGKGAKNKIFEYKVGSQIEAIGDTATWKTGNGGIPKTAPAGIPGITSDKELNEIAVKESGAKPLSIEDLENLFGWNIESIKKNENFGKYEEIFGKNLTANINCPQRKAEGINQNWADESIAKGIRKDVIIYNNYYWINDINTVVQNPYKNILWNGDEESYVILAQARLVNDFHDTYNFGCAGIAGNIFHSGLYSFISQEAGKDWSMSQIEEGVSTRILVSLSAKDVIYNKLNTATSDGKQIWEIGEKQTLQKGMQIGDIIKYDHKATGVKIEDKRLTNIVENQKVLKTTIGKGTASMPGTWSGNKQNFDANKIDTIWHVWGVDEVTGDVIIVSDIVAPFKIYGAIDYIWYEHNMHQIASIFGHGKGAKKKEFTYKVGSQLEDTGDTATWKTGTNGVPLTGARPLRTEDIEKAFGWTESNIKTDSKFTKRGNNWGGTTTLNINYPQRKVEGINQTWDNEQIAKGPKKNVTGYNRSYFINKDKIIDENDTNISEEKKKLYKQYINILWEWNNWKEWRWYQLGQVSLEVSSLSVSFGGGIVSFEYSDDFNSSGNIFVSAYTDGDWNELGINTYPTRVVAFLSSSDIIYRKTNDVGAHQEPVWDIELKNNPSKNIKVNMKNEFGENLSGVKFNLNVDGGESVLSRANLNINGGSVYSFNQSNVVMKDNKYKMEVMGLPTGADYKIISKYVDVHELTQDIVSFGKEDLEYDILIYRKDGAFVVPVTYGEGCEKDKEFSLEGKIKLMDGKNVVDTLDVTLKSGNNEFKFTDVKYFVNDKFKNYTIKYEGPGDVTVSGNGLEVKYTPPKKNYTIKAEFIFDKTLDTVPVELHANGKLLKNIDLLKSSDYITSENLPERDSSGNPITYTIQKGNIPSGYITEISGLTIIIRPVLTLPMTGSDSLKMLGITFGICTSLGFVLRKKKKMKMLNFNGVMK